ncbi:biopolymer transporter ExbD [Sphingomonas sp. Leaf407]|uniref:ExbD/TolR family protein n=1 Tax=unclassified Sphingomonas TaxID=196159 RepID=UPI0006FB7C65|nr:MULTISPECIES: biopolymer transporter ExbD [unclassified Sphingomonas]KQN37742.1 biopolymer transporter ExbD [Sphingomonas sp. Leaf42]KQT28109.1 biopolymer transporter ExbD [Sphingomonas sp. Leaf407]
MAMSAGGRADDEPMMDMNTTPLIDVLLVLLIMFIITIPIQSHAVKVDLPQPDTRQQQNIDPQKNKITINAQGAVAWNGTPVDEVTLTQYLDQTVAMDPQPELHFQPDATARYEVVDGVMAIIKRSNVTKLGFVGNEQYRNDF